MRKVKYFTWIILILLSSIGYSQQTIDVKIVSATDDAEESVEDNLFVNIGDVKTDNTELEMIYDDNVIRLCHLKIGLRFRNISIPQGATITNAYIQFTCKQVTTDVVNLTINGQNSDNSNGFTETGWNISARPLTSSSAIWIPQGWYVADEAGANQRTPDLSSVVQEIVDRTQWASGNALTFIISGIGKSRTAYAYDGEAQKAPLLHIEYSAAGIDDNDNDTKALLKPNPCSSYFSLQLKSNNNEEPVFHLFNQLGSEVSGLSFSKPGNGEYSFDISSIPSGLYFLSIETAGAKKTVKVIIAR
jgi:hypothetical protein